MDYPNDKIRVIKLLRNLDEYAEYGGFPEEYNNARWEAINFIIEGMTEEEKKEYEEYTKYW